MTPQALDALKALKAACAQVKAGTTTGTGYLVGPKTLVTCHHVVKDVPDGGEVTLLLGEHAVEHTARVVKRDDAVDAAVLELQAEVAIAPLLLGGDVPEDIPWRSFGFPAAAKDESLPFDGVVQDPRKRLRSGAEVLVLFSPQLAAGLATPVAGLSGGPVLVNGRVVGHLREIRSDPEHPRRPSFGQVFATPVDAVQRMLGIQPMAAPPPRSPADAPSIAPSDFHAFISYRSTDRRYALAIADGLEARGLRVFLDQNELALGDPLPDRLQEALGRSRGAVLLLSRGWLASPWCQEEGNALLQRTIDARGFRVVPIRVEDVEPPAMWAGRLRLDCLGRLPNAADLDAIADALSDRSEPEDATAARRAADQRVADEALTRLRVASQVSVTRLRACWQELVDQGLDSPEAALAAAEALLGHGEPAAAREVLSVAGAGTRASQLRALAYARSKRMDDALAILERLYAEGHVDPETTGLLAGRHKQRWLASGDVASLQRAFDVYRAGWEAPRDTFNGINAAALALALDRRPEAMRLASGVLDVFASRTPKDHWELATVGEAHLILGGVAEARTWYQKAVGHAPTRIQDIAVMRKQARRDLGYLGMARDILDAALPVPRVVAYTGHMTDASGRATPRFPHSHVPKVREAIQAFLQQIGNVVAFGSAARGADLLFLQTLQARHGRAHVFLPFPRDDFRATSVQGQWNTLFDEVLDNLDPADLTVLADEAPPPAEQPAAFAACNERILAEARAYAALLDERPLLLAVWDRKPGNGRGGTADTVEAWQFEGLDVEIVDP